jgi:hypothetical protein
MVSFRLGSPEQPKEVMFELFNSGVGWWTGVAIQRSAHKRNSRFVYS